MKIIFVIDSLRKGGIRTSLITLLENLDKNKYDIYLFSFHKISNEDKLELSRGIKYIESNSLFDIASSTSHELKETSKIKYFYRKLLAILCKIINSNIVYKGIFYTEKRLFECDIAVSYTNNVNDHSLYFGANKFVIEKVIASKKITWLHADYDMMKLNTSINNNEYIYFDSIVCVSKATAKSFIKHNKELEHKVLVIYNLLNTKMLNEQSKQDIYEEFNPNILNCITVMRFDQNKDPLFLIEVAKKMAEINPAFYWRVLGDGPLFEVANKRAKELKLDKNLKLYGYMKNPYPYLKYSDLYISTSTCESYGLSIVEALFFKLDILCGYYEAIEEVLSPNNGAIINKNVDEYANWIDKYIKNKKNDNQMHEKQTILNSNSIAIEKLNELFHLDY